MLIDDPQDPRLDDIRDLKHSDKEKGLVFAEGPLVAGRLVESRFPVRAIYGFGGRLESFLQDYGEELERRQIPVYEITRKIMGEVAG